MAIFSYLAKRFSRKEVAAIPLLFIYLIVSISTNLSSRLIVLQNEFLPHDSPNQSFNVSNKITPSIRLTKSINQHPLVVDVSPQHDDIENSVHQSDPSLILVTDNNDQATEKWLINQTKSLFDDRQQIIRISTQYEQINRFSNNFSSHHELLNCGKLGGPSKGPSQEMIYWKAVKNDYKVSIPLKNPNETQYLTFEVDEAGWNNIRMAFETVVGMAIATGRTLVLPPKLKMFHSKKKGKLMGFEDIFPLHSSGLKFISFEEFLIKEALTGSLIDQSTGLPSFPPYNRTDWNGLLKNHECAREGHGKILYGWLRNVTKVWKCNPSYSVGAFPSTPGPKGTKELRETFRQILALEKINNVTWKSRVDSFINNPTPVNSSAKARLKEMLADRTRLCMYDVSHQKAKVIHTLGEDETGYRMLVHFYAFIFVEDYKLDLYIKRFIRDNIRYNDELQCAAARVVAKVRQNARDNGSIDGSFDSFHIRRTDFKDFYSEGVMSAEEIFKNNTSSMISTKRTVYVASDERDFSYFLPLREHYNLQFLKDFGNEVQNIPTCLYGIIDQIIAAQGRTFVGTLYSTFSGYINRIRGYFSNSTDGSIDSFYMVPDSYKRFRTIMTQYSAVSPELWMREFPVAWRDIDHGHVEIVDLVYE